MNNEGISLEATETTRVKKANGLFKSARISLQTLVFLDEMPEEYPHVLRVS